MLVAAGKEFDRRTNRQIDQRAGRVRPRRRPAGAADPARARPAPAGVPDAMSVSRRRRAEAYSDPLLHALVSAAVAVPLGRAADRRVGRGRAVDRPRPPVGRALARPRAEHRRWPAGRPATAPRRRWSRARWSARSPGRATAGRRSPACCRTSCATRPRARRRCCGRGRRARAAWRRARPRRGTAALTFGSWALSRSAAAARAAPWALAVAAQPLLGEQHQADAHHQPPRAPAAERGGAVLALAHVHRHLHQAQAGVADADQRLDLGRLAHVGVRQQRERLVVDRVHAAGRVRERLAEAHRISSRSSEVPTTRSGAGW